MSRLPSNRAFWFSGEGTLKGSAMHTARAISHEVKPSHVQLLVCFAMCVENWWAVACAWASTYVG